MIIFPAIDLSLGKIVRLEKGDFEKKTIYSSNVINQITRFEVHHKMDFPPTFPPSDWAFQSSYFFLSFLLRPVTPTTNNLLGNTLKTRLKPTLLKPYFTHTALLTSPVYFLNDTTFWVAIISHLTTLKKKLLLFCILADNGPLNALQKYILDTINYQQENILRKTSIYFLLTISPQNPTLRSQETVKWSPSKEAFNC